MERRLAKMAKLTKYTEKDLAEDEDHYDANNEDDDSAGAFESLLYGPSV